MLAGHYVVTETIVPRLPADSSVTIKALGKIGEGYHTYTHTHACTLMDVHRHLPILIGEEGSVVFDGEFAPFQLCEKRRFLCLTSPFLTCTHTYCRARENIDFQCHVSGC